MGETKTDKRLKREFSSGGVVFKKLKVKSEKLKVLWLVTRTVPNEKFPKAWWRLPKGWVDDSKDGPGEVARGDRKATEEELKNAALREVREESGVEGKIISKIGTIKFFFNFEGQRILKFVTFYLMERIKDSVEGHDSETSEIAWLAYEEAYKKLTYPTEKQVLKKAKELLERPEQPNLI